MKKMVRSLALPILLALASCGTTSLPNTEIAARKDMNTKPGVFDPATPVIYMADLTAAEETYQLLSKQTDVPNANEHRGQLSRARQMLGTFRSMAGDTEGAIETYQSMSKLNAQTPTVQKITPTQAELATINAILANHEPKAALDAILREAKSRQIVILNEAHHVPRHRAFALLLALELRKVGFEYIAMETLTPDVAKLAQRGYPTRLDGYYSREPVFGDFVRQSLTVGYRPVAYESVAPPDQKLDMFEAVNFREQGQAQNIIDRVLKNDPKARIFIYVGYAHVGKGLSNTGAGKKTPWMAERLRRMTGIDPLCIDQTEMTAPVQGTKNYALADMIFEKMPGESVVLMDKTVAGNYWVGPFFEGRVDMQIIHRRTALNNGRPDWLSMSGYRKPHAIPGALLPAKGRRLIQAFVEGEVDNAVPMDQVIVSAGQSDIPKLMLPEGRYRFAFQD